MQCLLTHQYSITHRTITKFVLHAKLGGPKPKIPLLPVRTASPVEQSFLEYFFFIFALAWFHFFYVADERAKIRTDLGKVAQVLVSRALNP